MSKVIFKQNNNFGFVRAVDRFSKIEKLKAYGEKAINYFKTGKYIDYITRDEACFDFIGEMPEFKNDEEALNWFNSHTKGFNKLNNVNDVSSGLYSFNAVNLKFEAIELNEGKNMLSKLKENQYIWDTHLSFGEIGIAKRVMTPKQISKLLEENLNTFFTRNNLNLNNLNVLYAIHANTKNPHIHLAFWEKEPKLKYVSSKELQFKKDGLIPLGEFKTFGTIITNKILEKERYKSYYEAVGELRNLKVDVKQDFKSIDLKGSKLNDLVNGVIKNKNSNVWNYARLDAKSKNAVDSLVLEIIKQEDTLFYKYAEFENQVMLIDNKFNRKYEKEQANKLIEKERKELKINLGNLVLNKLKEFERNKLSNVGYINYLPNANYLKSKNIFNTKYKWEIKKIKFENEKRELEARIKALKQYSKHLEREEGLEYE
ncbi:Uncharacterised protein [Mycoplasmopsis maculosa]|uniref:Uncharacterized protein n=1 Tax=Mycoplasmopsis maculosa TaxID=114885 RepID=A0A449B482_9BACT|nr:relaxase MobL [Mycoplasmopsis maculosa]VEU75390.1 Uncharacterised protein [Mycoplasmopsis maculosa]